MKRLSTVRLLLSALASSQAYAGFDHELPLDQNRIWARQYQTGLENGVIALEVAGSLWFGNDNELGHTFWQTIDASAISGIGATALKYAFSRAAPTKVTIPMHGLRAAGIRVSRAARSRIVGRFFQAILVRLK
jgi:undecaprenyl-diphosphatase